MRKLLSVNYYKNIILFYLAICLSTKYNRK